MKATSRALVATAILSTFVALAGASTPDQTLEEIAPYRQWTRVTLKPMAVDISAFAG